MKKYLEYINGEPKPGRKTKVLYVRNIKTGFYLGVIRWFTNWRKYTFEPYHAMIFDQVCLREIADFIEEETKKHKEKINGK